MSMVPSQVVNKQAVDAWMLEERAGMVLSSVLLAPLQHLFEELEWSAWDIPTEKLTGAAREARIEVWKAIFRACKNIRLQETSEETSDVHIAKSVAWAMQPTQVEAIKSVTKKMPAGHDLSIRRPGRVTLALEEGSRA